MPSKSEPILGHPWQTNFRGKLTSVKTLIPTGKDPNLFMELSREKLAFNRCDERGDQT
jgi:hypothetical protein